MAFSRLCSLDDTDNTRLNSEMHPWPVENAAKRSDLAVYPPGLQRAGDSVIESIGAGGSN